MQPLANLGLTLGQERALCRGTVNPSHICMGQLELGARVHTAFPCCLIMSSHLTLSQTTPRLLGSMNQGLVLLGQGWVHPLFEGE